MNTGRQETGIRERVSYTSAGYQKYYDALNHAALFRTLAVTFTSAAALTALLDPIVFNDLSGKMATTVLGIAALTAFASDRRATHARKLGRELDI